MSEIYGSTGYDSGGDGYRPPSANDGYRPPSSYDGYRPPGNDRSDSWENYDSEAELERLGITREGERERANAAWDRQQDDSDDAWDQDPGGDDLPDDTGLAPDIYAIIPENDHLPEPRTLQHSARDGAGHDRDGNLGSRDEQAHRDTLPSPAESVAKTWGPDAENWDEAEQAYVKYDRTGVSDGMAHAREDDITAAEQAPTLTEAGTEIDDANRGEHPYPTGTDQHADPTSQPDGSERAPEAVGETVDVLRQKVADLEAANARLEARDAERDNVMAEQETENAQLGRTFAKVKAENADLRHDVTNPKIGPQLGVRQQPAAGCAVGYGGGRVR